MKRLLRAAKRRALRLAGKSPASPAPAAFETPHSAEAVRLGLFDAAWYLSKNPDIARSGVNPVRHYFEHGWKEGREPGPIFGAAWYLSRYGLENSGTSPIAHFLAERTSKALAPSPYLDLAWVTQEYARAKRIVPDVLADFLNQGWREFAPHPGLSRFFDERLKLLRAQNATVSDFFVAILKEIQALPLDLDSSRLKPHDDVGFSVAHGPVDAVAGLEKIAVLIWGDSSEGMEEILECLLQIPFSATWIRLSRDARDAEAFPSQFSVAHVNVSTDNWVEELVAKIEGHGIALSLSLPESGSALTPNDRSYALHQLCASPRGVWEASLRLQGNEFCWALWPRLRSTWVEVLRSRPTLRPLGGFLYFKPATLRALVDLSLGSAELRDAVSAEDFFGRLFDRLRRNAEYSRSLWSTVVGCDLPFEQASTHSEKRPYYSAKAPAWRSSVERRADRARKTCVYTAITGGYDNLKVPEVIDDGVEYICFSDRPLQLPAFWKLRPIPYHHPDPARVARWVKLNPHFLLEGFDRAAWVDSSILLRASLEPFFARVSPDLPLLAVSHPNRDCVFVEAEACRNLGKDDAGTIARQVERYRAEGVPEKGGLIESGLFVLDLSAAAGRSFFETWWKEIEIGSRRDQIGYAYAHFKHPIPKGELFPNSTSVRNSFQTALFAHGATGNGYYEDPFVMARSSIRAPEGGRPASSSLSVKGSVVVCVYNARAEVEACLSSVRDSLPANWEIVVIDDASAEETRDSLATFAGSDSRIRLLRNEQNLGYTRSANRGLREATGDFRILLNSDTLVPSGALAKLAAAAYSHPSVGIVGPLSNAASYQSVPGITGSKNQTAVNDLPEGVTVVDADALCSRLSAGMPFPMIPLVHGFCFGIKREVIERIGFMDEVAFPFGYGEENDYCLRALDAGFKAIVATDTYVFHHKSKSFSDSDRRGQLMKAGGAALKSKHGADKILESVRIMSEHPLLVRMREAVNKEFNKSGDAE